jgi:hypothetical protein
MKSRKLVRKTRVVIISILLLLYNGENFSWKWVSPSTIQSTSSKLHLPLDLLKHTERLLDPIIQINFDYTLSKVLYIKILAIRPTTQVANTNNQTFWLQTALHPQLKPHAALNCTQSCIKHTDIYLHGSVREENRARSASAPSIRPKP